MVYLLTTYGLRFCEASESPTSYSVEQADVFQYQSYSHSDDMFIILKSNINTDTSIIVLTKQYTVINPIL
jgi:hypothetical protein